SVREAIISLELAGRVDVRMGTGVYVNATAPAPAAGAARDFSAAPFELLAARKIVEGEIAALAARSIRRAGLRALAENIEALREHAPAHVRRTDADRDFHVRIATSTGNAALALVVSELWSHREGDLWKRMEAHFHTETLRSRALADHEAILAALAAHDPER